MKKARLRLKKKRGRGRGAIFKQTGKAASIPVRKARAVGLILATNGSGTSETWELMDTWVAADGLDTVLEQIGWICESNDSEWTTGEQNWWISQLAPETTTPKGSANRRGRGDIPPAMIRINAIILSQTSYGHRRWPIANWRKATILSWSNATASWSIFGPPRRAWRKDRTSVMLDANQVVVPFGQRVVKPLLGRLKPLPLYEGSHEGRHRGDANQEDNLWGVLNDQLLLLKHRVDAVAVHGSKRDKVFSERLSAELREVIELALQREDVEGVFTRMTAIGDRLATLAKPHRRRRGRGATDTLLGKGPLLMAPPKSWGWGDDEWAYVATITPAGGYMVGFAHEGEKGYCPANIGPFASYDEASGTAERMNKARGMGMDRAFKIIASTMSFGSPNRRRRGRASIQAPTHPGVEGRLNQAGDTMTVYVIEKTRRGKKRKARVAVMIADLAEKQFRITLLPAGHKRGWTRGRLEDFALESGWTEALVS